MPFRVVSTHLNGVIVIEPRIFRDARGFFLETYRKDSFTALGIPTEFVQDNHSASVRGVVRGLHFQWDPPVAKLMRVTFGRAFLVAVDIRRNSPTLGKYVGIEATPENGLQMWAPPGFARGFCSLSEVAEIQYKCTGIYNPRGESGIRWDDSTIGIDWPLTSPLLSEKDDAAQTLNEWLQRPESGYFQY